MFLFGIKKYTPRLKCLIKNKLKLSHLLTKKILHTVGLTYVGFERLLRTDTTEVAATALPASTIEKRQERRQ